jgi:hypothetical protein
MDLSPSWKATSCTGTQELPNILWKPKVHSCVHKGPSPAPVLSQINQDHTTLPHLSKIHFSIIHPPTSLSCWWSLSLRLSHKYPICFPLHRSSCYTPLILIDSITLTIHGEEYKLWSYSLCRFLQPSLISSLFGPTIHLSTLLSNNLSLSIFFNARDKVSYLYRTTVKVMVLNILILMFLDSRWEYKGSGPSGSSHYPILICYCRFQIFERCHILKGSVSCLCVMILPFILLPRHQHVLSFLCICF